MAYLQSLGPEALGSTVRKAEAVLAERDKELQAAEAKAAAAKERAERLAKEGRMRRWAPCSRNGSTAHCSG